METPPNDRNDKGRSGGVGETVIVESMRKLDYPRQLGQTPAVLLAARCTAVWGNLDRLRAHPRSSIMLHIASFWVDLESWPSHPEDCYFAPLRDRHESSHVGNQRSHQLLAHRRGWSFERRGRASEGVVSVAHSLSFRLESEIAPFSALLLLLRQNRVMF